MSETTSDHANQYYPPFLGLPHGCDRVVKWVIRHLENDGQSAQLR